jgi:hypothetical protein
MQPMRSHLMELKGPPFYSFGGWGGWVFSRCVWWRTDCPLFTFHLKVDFPCSLSFFFPFFFLGGVGESKQRVPKFLACSPKEIPIAPHFYPICFGKCCPAFTYKMGQMVGTLYLKIALFYYGSHFSFIFFE